MHDERITGMDAIPASVFRGCLFCKSGRESDVARRYKKLFPGGRAVAPMRTRYRRRDGAELEEQVPLLPGYVFFEATISADTAEAGNSALRAFSRTDSVLKLLSYSDGMWRLQGSDDQFARMLLETDGSIGASRAFFDEGNRIRILSGFLKDYEGSIVRVNKRRRTVEASIDFHDKKVSMWLGYELVTKVGSEDG